MATATQSGMWDCLQRTGLINRLRPIYEQPFPIEVRYYQKDYIEQVFVKTNLKLNPNFLDNFPVIVELLRGLCLRIDNTIQKLQGRTSAENDTQLVAAQVETLNKSRNLIRASCDTPAELVNIYKLIHKILVAELRLLKENGFIRNCAPTNINNAANIFPSSSVEQDSSPREAQSPGFDFYTQLQGLETGLDPIITQLPDPNCHQQYLHSLQSFLNQMYCIYSRLTEVRRSVLEDLTKWQSITNKPLPELDDIESRHRAAIAISKSCRVLVDKLKKHLERHQIESVSADDLESKFFEIHGSLVKKALAIEKPPKQILRTCTNFAADVRCLLDKSSFKIGNLKTLVMNHEDFMELLDKSNNCSRMKLSDTSYVIVSEASSSGKPLSPAKGRKAKPKKGLKPKAQAIAGSSSTVILVAYDSSMGQGPSQYRIRQAYPWLYANEVEWSTTEDHLVASFMKVKVAGKGAKRDKQKRESVLYESFFMIFHTEVTEIINGETVKWWIWTASPKSNRITTNKIQDIGPYEAVVWCRAADIGERNNYSNEYSGDNLPDTLPWKNVCVALSEWFCELTNAGLTPEHLEYLRSKLGCPPRNTPDGHITRAQFVKKKLPGRDFTFWKWLYGIAELIAAHLSAKGSTEKRKVGSLWEDGVIVGFIDKDAAADLLRRCQKGTFLLRFSDSVAGAITIGYVGDNRAVNFVYPKEKDDLKASSFASHILNMEDIKFLYPNIPKKEIFGKYPVDEKPKSLPGYVRTYTKFLTSWSRRSLNPAPEVSAANEVNEQRPPTSSPQSQPQASQEQHSPVQALQAANGRMNYEQTLPSFASTFPPTSLMSPPGASLDQNGAGVDIEFDTLTNSASGTASDLTSDLLAVINDFQDMEVKVTDPFLRLFDSDGSGVSASWSQTEQPSQSEPAQHEYVDLVTMTYQVLEAGNWSQVNGHAFDSMDTDADNIFSF